MIGSLEILLLQIFVAHSVNCFTVMSLFQTSKSECGVAAGLSQSETWVNT